MISNPFLILGIVLFSAYLAKRLAHLLNIPEVTCYVLLGILLGGSLLDVLSDGAITSLQPLSTAALGIIAFMIGMDLKLDVLKKLGRPIFFIVLFESVGAFVAVFSVLSILFPGMTAQSLLLSAVASATAPAATVAVIRQYKAKGPLTSTILAVVGLDDAAALIIYVFASSVAKTSLTGARLHVWPLVSHAVLSISASIALGAAMAIVFIVLLRRVRKNDWITLVLAASIITLLGIAEHFALSELLAIMAFSALVTNLAPVVTRKTGTILQYYTPIFLAAFFIMGGAHLNVRLVLDIGLIGLAYFFARLTGKVGGASLGAWIGGAPPTIRRYTGFALLPQVGVALALALSIKKDFDVPGFGAQGHQMAVLIINVLLFTTIATEVIGPLLTRAMLRRAGETSEP